MKLIIDVPKRVYDMTKEMGNVIDADNEVVAKAIANGKPLDDELQEIRQEIVELKKDFTKYDDWRKQNGLYYALEIIDKYKAESDPQKSEG